jgi:CPA1 family monovalent cation:H+ antiporter
MHETSGGLTPFDLAAMLVVASGVRGWFYRHFVKLPHVIGLTMMGAPPAIGLLFVDAFIPAATLEQMNFTDTLLDGLLSFLLCAGALIEREHFSQGGRADERVVPESIG